ncbi:hypothetical protein GA0074695_2918 [Micromonospora viridifaciens]|uniref:Uncharacterized protein n=1 Tax=Micromonospora viridifaciens TaxID=1881 RepID=A0A1C4X180_MICVI|nr:hypothetical protein [Micromonospora viridifaciens]SCF02209.1 hypothetical protein GA0074695_2918 [Micromonospora viridifaciens]
MSDLRTLDPETREEQRAWDYGDFPYGLEPLIMPPLDQPAVLAPPPPDLLTAYDVERTRAALELPPRATGLALPDSTDALYWFRWITGHQVTMLLWNLMGALVASIAEGEDADDRTLTDLESCTNGYTAMLQYSGSCSPEIYQALIRPRMYLQHRGFSGLWAADFAPLRRLLRGQAMPWMTGPAGARLVAAVATNRAAHEAVAARLVPAGKSLLQQSVAGTAVRPTPRTAAIFDNFFMTIRAPVGRDAVVAQLLHRVRAVALDLAANGSPSTADEILAPLRRVVADLPRFTR